MCILARWWVLRRAGGDDADRSHRNADRHRLVVPVPENDVAGVPEGTMVSFTVPSFPGRTFRAPIARISHGVDIKTRTMPVELDVRDPHAELVPGTFCEVEWPMQSNLPDASLFQLPPWRAICSEPS